MSNDGEIYGIKQEISEIIKERNGIIEINKLHEHEMKEMHMKGSLMGTRLLLRSKLNGRYKIRAIHVWVVALIKHGAGIMSYKKHKIQEMNRRRLKLITMSKGLDPKNELTKSV